MVLTKDTRMRMILRKTPRKVYSNLKGKSICIKFACLRYHSFRSFYIVDGGKSCFRSSERKVVSTPPLRADFTQQSSPRSSQGLLRKTNLCRAFLQQEVSHLFMFTHKTYCLFNCWLYGIGIRFIPNNLKRKARCGSDLLEYVQVNKIMQKLRKRKVRKEKCSKIVKLVTNYKAALFDFCTDQIAFSPV